MSNLDTLLMSNPINSEDFIKVLDEESRIMVIESKDKNVTEESLIKDLNFIGLSKYIVNKSKTANLTDLYASINKLNHAIEVTTDSKQVKIYRILISILIQRAGTLEYNGN